VDEALMLDGKHPAPPDGVWKKLGRDYAAAGENIIQVSAPKKLHLGF
jgi:hypothetical protein